MNVVVIVAVMVVRAEFGLGRKKGAVPMARCHGNTQCILQYGSHKRYSLSSYEVLGTGEQVPKKKEEISKEAIGLSQDP